MHTFTLIFFILFCFVVVGYGVRFNIKTVFPGMNFHYKDKTVVRPSYLSNGNPILVRRHLYIATAPWTLLFKSFISSIDILRFSSEIAHMCMPQDLWWPVNTIDPVLWQHTASLGHIGPTHWGRVTHICVGKLTIIGSDNGLSPGRRQAKIWTNAEILLIGPLGTNFSEILIALETFSFKKLHLKISSAKWRPFCLGLNVLRNMLYLIDSSP